MKKKINLKLLDKWKIKTNKKVFLFLEFYFILFIMTVISSLEIGEWNRAFGLYFNGNFVFGLGWSSKLSRMCAMSVAVSSVANLFPEIIIIKWKIYTKETNCNKIELLIYKLFHIIADFFLSNLYPHLSTNSRWYIEDEMKWK